MRAAFIFGPKEKATFLVHCSSLMEPEPTPTDEQMMVTVDQNFARDYPLQARELETWRANFRRILDKVNEIAAKHDDVKELALWFPDATERSMQPPQQGRWRDFVMKVRRDHEEKERRELEANERRARR